MILASLMLVVVAATANAQAGRDVNNDPVVQVSSNISVSTTWYEGITYDLTTQVFVTNGASLTIEAGVNVISTATANGAGSLAVTRGSQIHALGTSDNPIIFTSSNDLATWTNGDRRTGVWREAANEWGNITIMGRGYISEDDTPPSITNTPAPNASNEAVMEGLTAGGGVSLSDISYGGGNDDDDSGTLRYVSLRYGGRVIGLTNELNGLSLGAIGRETDVSHVEIMNNVDDGVEVWGGAANFKNISIWNIGDDSFDVDQGWRGKAQFILICQGYSIDDDQGSGVGDNAFEIDGGEDSFWQPLTTCRIENFTVIGTLDGDGATVWRDGARAQYRRGIIYECGERVVRFDNIDGDGGQGYGAMGTLGFADTFVTSYTFTEPNNAFANPAAAYQAQTDGFLSEIVDTVLFNNADYGHFDNPGGAGLVNLNDVVHGNTVEPASSPLQSVVRAPIFTSTNQGKDIDRVAGLDPRPANDALVIAGVRQPAANDPFFTRTNYRGAFDPCAAPWTFGWSASYAFGFCDESTLVGAPAGCPSGCQSVRDNGSIQASLDINGARNAAGSPVADGVAGPFYTQVARGSSVEVNVRGEANMPVALIIGTGAGADINCGAIPLPGTVGQFDTGTAAPFPVVISNFAFVVNGFVADNFLNASARTDSNGDFSFSFDANFPGAHGGFTVQGIIANTDPLANIWTTNAVRFMVD